MELFAFAYVGELAGLGTAACWSLCSLAFTSAGKRIGAMAVNQLRIPLAIVLLSMTHRTLFGTFWPTGVATQQIAMLVFSGFIGLTLGDLFLFRCFVLIGPRLGTLLMTAAPLFAAALAWPLLDERLHWGAILGIALTLAGVAWVLAIRSHHGLNPAQHSDKSLGILLGLLGAAGQAVGLVLAKLGMSALDPLAESVPGSSPESAGPVDPLSATLIRMVGGAIGIWIIAAVRGNIVSTIRAISDRRAMAGMALGTVLGPFLGVWSSLVSVTHAPAGIAATLMATVPIIMLPLSRIAYGDRPGTQAVAGTMLAVFGVAVLFLAGN